MAKYKNPAIVIGGGANGLGIVRDLGRDGVDVYCVVDTKKKVVYSRYCKKYFVIPGVEHDIQKLSVFLTKLERQLTAKAVLFPTSDISVLNTASLVDELDGYLAPISNNKVLETLIIKPKFYRSLQERNVPHPITLFSNWKTGKDAYKNFSFPILIKPSISQIFFKNFGRKGFVAKSERELYHYLDLAIKRKIAVYMQEMVPGPASNHYFIEGCLDRNSKPVALFARRRLRMWPLTLGNSTACESIPIHAVFDMKETVVQYLASLGFWGLFSAEFKRDSRDNVNKLLEINARSWLYTSFSSACGVNLAMRTYLGALGEETTIGGEYALGFKMIYLREDLKWLLVKLVQRKLPFREWISSLMGKKVELIVATDDLNPVVMSSLENLVSVMRVAFQVCKQKDLLQGNS